MSKYRDGEWGGISMGGLMLASNKEDTVLDKLCKKISEIVAVETHISHKQDLYLLLFGFGVSQIEIERVLRESASTTIVNKVKVIRDMNSIIDGGFNSRLDFELTIDAIVERLNHVGYSVEEISEKVHLVKLFANEQSYREIVEIDITISESLVSVVYGRYGNLDNYLSIEAMNGLADNDYVLGKIRVFA